MFQKSKESLSLFTDTEMVAADEDDDNDDDNDQ